MKTWTIITLVSLTAVALIVYTQLTIFVIQPLGALPEGRTLIIWRRGKLKFIDSADGVCDREGDGVSLLCRMAILGAVAKNDSILARLPYSETLYLLSTDGKTYEK